MKTDPGEFESLDKSRIPRMVILMAAYSGRKNNKGRTQEKYEREKPDGILENGNRYPRVKDESTLQHPGEFGDWAARKLAFDYHWQKEEGI